MGDDLRTRIVRAATAVIERDGVEATSLRKVASEAGVSRQAPYLCFPEKVEMLAAAAAEAMRRERAIWADALSAIPDASPGERLEGIARANARFALEHPHLYDLVYGRYVAKSASEELQQEAIRSFALFRETVASCNPPGTDIETVRRRTLYAWALLHGLLELHRKRQIPASITGDLDAWIAEGFAQLRRSWG